MSIITLREQDRTPLYEQIYSRIVELIANGVMKPDEQLPSVRQLAHELGINPNTVSKAYVQLEQDKIVYTLVGRGSFVATGKPDVVTAKLVADFTSAAEAALKAGISPQELRVRVDRLAEQTENERGGAERNA